MKNVTITANGGLYYRKRCGVVTSLKSKGRSLGFLRRSCMSKRVLILLVVFLLPASVFAVDLIGLRVGPTAMLNYPINPEAVDEDFFSNLEIDDFSLGIDARFNLTVFEVNALALIEPKTNVDGDLYGANIKANIGAGISLPLLDIVKLGVFAGPAVNFALTTEGLEEDDFPMSQDELFASNLFLRLTADVMLGNISVGGTYILDTNTNLNNVLDPEFDPGTIFDNLIGQAGVSVLFELF